MEAGIYTRISSDPTGQALGVARQLEDCLALAERRGWNVREVFTDNDISAYTGKARPQYRRMLKAIKAGEVQAIVAWHPDRLYRRMQDLEELIDVAHNSKCEIATVTAGDVDLNTATGKGVARIVGVMARMESDHKVERTLRKWQQMRDSGQLRTAGRRAYGYEKDGKTIRESEAAIVREASARVLAGETAHAIMLDFNRRQIRTSTGGAWRRGALLDILLNPRYSGRLGQRPGVGEYLPGKHGHWSDSHVRILGLGGWPAIISIEDQDRLRGLLTGIRPDNIRPAAYLLTGGITVCGRCRGALVAHVDRGHQVQRRRADGTTYDYRNPARLDLICKADTTGKKASSCNRLSIRMDKVEEAVTKAVLRRIERGALDDLLSAPDTEALDDLLEVESKLTELAREWGAGRMSSSERDAAKAGLLPQQKELKRRIEASRTKIGIEGLPDDVGAAWEAGQLTLEQKRTVIKSVIDVIVIDPAVIIPPATRPRNVFDPDRIKPIWLKPQVAPSN